MVTESTPITNRNASRLCSIFLTVKGPTRTARATRARPRSTGVTPARAEGICIAGRLLATAAAATATTRLDPAESRIKNPLSFSWYLDFKCLAIPRKDMPQMIITATAMVMFAAVT